jgi:hypothetical protein
MYANLSMRDRVNRRSHASSLPLSVVRVTPRLGLRENWQHLTLLVFINAFVDGMVGLERTVVP